MSNVVNVFQPFVNPFPVVGNVANLLETDSSVALWNVESLRPVTVKYTFPRSSFVSGYVVAPPINIANRITGWEVRMYKHDGPSRDPQSIVYRKVEPSFTWQSSNPVRFNITAADVGTALVTFGTKQQFTNVGFSQFYFISDLTDKVPPSINSFSASAASESSATLSWNVTDDTDPSPGLRIAAYTSASSPSYADLVAGTGEGYYSGITVADAADVTSTTLGSLLAGTPYSFYAGAIDKQRNTSVVSLASATTPDNTPPNFANFRVSRATETTFTALFDPVTDNSGTAAIIVSVYSSAANPSASDIANNVSHPDLLFRRERSKAELVASIVYGSIDFYAGRTVYVYCIATDASGNHTAPPLSDTVTFPDETPPEFTSFASSSPTTNTITLSWNAITDNLDSDPVLHVALFGGATSTSAADVIAGTGALEHISVTNLSAVTSYEFGSGSLGESALALDTQYHFHAVAVDAAGNASEVRTLSNSTAP